MLQIIIPAEERWDEEHEEFIVSKKEQKLMLEHSLVSLSKWESKCLFYQKRKRHTRKL